jgi:hypothetical protein
VFLNSFHRDKRNQEKKTVLAFCHLFFKLVIFQTFRHVLFANKFVLVILNSHCEVAPENAIKQKKVEKKLTTKFLAIFWRFSGLLHFFVVVFLNSPYLKNWGWLVTRSLSNTRVG